MSEKEAKIFFDSGIKFFNEKNYILAEKNFEKALDLAPERISILENLASLYFINSKFEKSLEIINKLIDLKVKEKKIILLKYKILTILGKINELKKFIDEHLISGSDGLKYKVIKGLIYPNFFEDQQQIDEYRNNFIQSLDKLSNFEKIQLNIDKEIVNPPVFKLSYDQYENKEINSKLVKLFRNKNWFFFRVFL